MKKRFFVAFLGFFIFLGVYLNSHYSAVSAQCGCSCAVICRYTCEFECFDCTEAQEAAKGQACCEEAFRVTPDQGACTVTGGQS